MNNFKRNEINRLSFSRISEAIYNHFFEWKRVQDGYLLLSFDELDLEIIAKKLNCEKEEICEILKDYFKTNWDRLLNNLHYFGLIALQSYAASLMEKDGEITEYAYLPKLNDLLGLQDNNQTQKLFIGKANGSPVQELIWQKAKTHLKEKGYVSTIPDRKEGKGRYVQYPLSQALLNKEDLKYFSNHFLELGLREGESFSFDEFSKRISLKEISNSSNISTHAKNIIKKYGSDEVISTIISRQIFSYFQDWDGNPYEQSKKTSSEKKNLALLLIQEEEDFFNLYNREDTNEPLILNKEVFEELKKWNYKPFHSAYPKLILFRNIPQYPDDYEDTRFVDVGDTIIVLFDSIRHNEFLGDFYKKPKKCAFGDIVLLKFKVEESDLDSSKFPNFSKFIKSFPLRLHRGLRLGRTNTWLENAGPTLEIQKNISKIFINGKKNKDEIQDGFLSFKDYPVGEYSIKIENHTALNFEIKASDFEQIVQTEPNKWGWNNQDWESTKEPNLSGHQLFTEESGSLSTTRNWINVLSNKKLTISKNIVIQSIKRSKPWHIQKR